MSDNRLDQFKPLVAILRGVRPDEVLDVADILVEAGFEAIEVPLNSPEPFISIGKLAEKYGTQCLIGAGTVTSTNEVEKVHAVGGELVVSPNTNASVIKAAKYHDMICLPGVATPTEAFTALEAGADGLKLFPASALHVSFFKAIASVLPKSTRLFAVGGTDEKNIKHYMEYGITGFGFGSSLYKAGQSLDSIKQSALAIINQYAQLTDKK